MQFESLNTRRECGFDLRAQALKSQWRHKSDSAAKQTAQMESWDTGISVKPLPPRFSSLWTWQGSIADPSLGHHGVEVVSTDPFETGLRSTALKQLQNIRREWLKIKFLKATLVWGNHLCSGRVFLTMVYLSFLLLPGVIVPEHTLECWFLYFWNIFFTPGSWKTCRPRALWAELPPTKWELKWLD